MDIIVDFLRDNYQVIINIVFFGVTTMWIKDKKSLDVAKSVRDLLIRQIENSNSKDKKKIISQQIKNALERDELYNNKVALEGVMSNIAHDSAAQLKRNIASESMKRSLRIQKNLTKAVKDITK
jgi:hypothetical protein